HTPSAPAASPCEGSRRQHHTTPAADTTRAGVSRSLFSCPPLYSYENRGPACLPRTVCDTLAARCRDDLGEFRRAGAHRPGLRGIIHCVQTKGRFETVFPLEIVRQRPMNVAQYMDVRPVAHEARHRGQVL